MGSISPDLAFYVCEYYLHLLTATERLANRHLQTTFKNTAGRSDAIAQAEVRGMRPRSRWLSDDPEVLTLAADGLEVFRARVAQRILDEHKPEVILNYCPKCAGLTRTPRAKWCPHCGHDWH